MAKNTMGVRINGHLVNREDFRELILNLQETARALKEYREEGKDNEGE